MLARRFRRRPNIKTTSRQCLVLAGCKPTFFNTTNDHELFDKFRWHPIWLKTCLKIMDKVRLVRVLPSSID